MWKKKSIFWELPYWEVLDVRHAIDVMHLTKNLCINQIGFLGVYGKTEDTLEGRQELQRMEERDALHPEKRDKGRHYLSPTNYTLSKEEKESMFECLSSIKVQSGYTSNIKGILNLPEKKLTNLKSHDCYVLMTELLSLVLWGILPENVRLTIVKLCAFLNAISQKVIDPDNLIKLQNDVVQCLVGFELIFSQTTSSSSPCERYRYPQTCIPTQHVPLGPVLTFVLTLLMTINRLGSLNRGMRGDYIERAH